MKTYLTAALVMGAGTELLRAKLTGGPSVLTIKR
jgi:chemotaxis receptor (MCP) glutamine deamidase CheD